MANTKKKSSIGEDLADLAIKNSDHSQEADEMKDEVNERRKNKRIIGKNRGFTPVDYKIKRRGDVIQATEYEKAIANIFHVMAQTALEDRDFSTYSDIVLDLIANWEDRSSQLVKSGKINSKLLRDPQGKLLIACPWIAIAIEQLCSKQFSEIFHKRSGKKKKISSKIIRSQISSIFSTMMKSFTALGLISVKQKSAGLISTYRIHKKLYGFSLEQLSHLSNEGRKLLERKDNGEFDDDEKSDGSEKLKSQKLVIPGVVGAKIKKRTITIGADDSIEIETFYR